MNKLTKVILNLIAIALYAVAFISFFTDFIYVWILGIGKAGSYKGYEVALNFDGMPSNLATLGPLLLILGTLVFAIIVFIKRLATYKKAPKESNGGTLKPLLSALFFVIFPLVSMFLCLSTFDILQLPAPKRYGGYYMGTGPYLAAYLPVVGGLILFIIQSGIFKDKVETPKAMEAPKKVEAKPAPTAPQAKPVVQPAKPAQPAPAKVAPQAAKPVQPQARPAQQVKAAPQAQKLATPQAKPAVQPARPAQPQAKAAAKPVAKQTQQIKK